MADIQMRYRGQGADMFRLAFTSGLLMVVTLGIYRFWAKSRIRRFVWSSVDIGGDRLEYTGTGLEKFLGFLVAVVILAVYLGLVQLALFFMGLHFIVAPTSPEQAFMQLAVIYLSFLALVPLMLFARYRARRYLMVRTRLRGIRFGMDKAAWGYVWRAILHGIVTFVTLGILLPRQTFWLEKYKTDRTWYGDQRFTQGGHWTGLYPAMKHLFIGVGLMLFGVFVLMAAAVYSMGQQTKPPGLAGLSLVVGYIWAIVGYISYRVQGHAYLTSTKTLGDSVGFAAAPRTGRVIGIYVAGVLVSTLITGVAVLIAGVTVMAVVGATPVDNIPGPGGFAVIALIYLLVITLSWALSLVFLIQPIIAYMTETTSVLNADALASVRQRAGDAGADAEGFAEALDLGGAI